jgi:transposase
MNLSHYIGFDLHKKHINFCVKTADGAVVEQGRLAAQRSTLREWAAGQVLGWHGATEATLFSGWIYDTLKPYAAGLEMAHPLMLKAIAASKKKNDSIDARKIADLVRCNLLPTCYVATPQIRELRRLLRYRNLVVREPVRMQNKIAGLLMESGAPSTNRSCTGKNILPNCSTRSRKCRTR